jgi:hypothetical protein
LTRYDQLLISWVWQPYFLEHLDQLFRCLERLVIIKNCCEWYV